MITLLFSRLIILCCGTLFPAYGSFKAIRGKISQDYVIYMMYWIVFALFCCLEAVTDIFLPWIPFYYELKVLLVLWLLPTTNFNGSALLYRNYIHPQLKRREPQIDAQVERVKEQGYATVRELSSRCCQHFRAGVMDLVQQTLRLVGQTHQQQQRPPAATVALESDVLITELNAEEAADQLELREFESLELLVGKASQHSLSGPRHRLKKTTAKTSTASRGSSRSHAAPLH